MINLPRAELEQMYKDLGALLGREATPPTKTKEKAEKAEKKPHANAGQGTAWSSFCTKIQLDHKEEVEQVKAADKEARAAAKAAGEEAPKAGAHLAWCGAYKTAHEAEWLAYKADWDVAHPKSSKSSVAGSDGEAAPKPKKAKAPLSDEEKAAKKAKAAAKKAAKAAAPAPAPAPAAEAHDEADDAELEEAEEASVAEAAPAAEEAEEAEDADDLFPFGIAKGALKGKYLRFGHQDAEGAMVWHSDGDLWSVKADGSKDAYLGQLRGGINGSISKTAANGEALEEPEVGDE